MDEIWKDIPEYFGLYQASNTGRIRSLNRIIPTKNGKNLFYKGRILFQSTLPNGRKMVRLSKNNKRGCDYVHRLVALTFIPNPNNLPQINHKDENPQNNQVGNLEWCTRKYNMNYGSLPKRLIKKRNKPVAQINPKTGHIIAVYDSIGAASKAIGLDYHSCTIGRVCQGSSSSYQTAYGYKWKFLPE